MAKHKAEDDEPGDASEPKRLVFLHGEIKTPPFSEGARRECGRLLRVLQRGDSLSMPNAEPLPTVGPRCGAIRVPDEQHNWRIMYRVDATRVLVVDVYDNSQESTGQVPDTAPQL